MAEIDPVPVSQCNRTVVVGSDNTNELGERGIVN